MFALDRARAGACAVAVVAACIVFSSEAAAKSRTKPRMPEAERATDIPIPKFSSGTAAAARPALDRASAPMRFFTINGALAKFEGRANDADKLRYASVSPSDRATDAPAPTRTPARGNEPFGMFAFRAPQGTLWSKWARVQSNFATEERRLVECHANADACDSASHALVAMAQRAGQLDGRARFEAVTQAANAAIRYTTDYAQHGVIDLWTSPLATLESGRGDCEDYAILKYQVLREAGTPAADLKIVLLRDTATREDHAVLAARTGERWYILDNRRAGFYADGDLPHYLPLFALNHDGVQLFAAPYAARQGQPSEDAVPATTDEAGNTPAALATLPVLL